MEAKKHVKLDGTQDAVDKLQQWLDEVQKRCTARTLDAYRIIAKLQTLETELSIPKYALKGVKIEYDGAEPFPGKYRGTPESTWFTAEHDGKLWRITSIERYTCPNRSTTNATVTLTETAKAKILERLSYISI